MVVVNGNPEIFCVIWMRYEVVPARVVYHSWPIYGLMFAFQLNSSCKKHWKVSGSSLHKAEHSKTPCIHAVQRRFKYRCIIFHSNLWKVRTMTFQIHVCVKYPRLKHSRSTLCKIWGSMKIWKHSMSTWFVSIKTSCGQLVSACSGCSGDERELRSNAL